MKKFFDEKKPREIWIDEKENFEKYYKDDIAKDPTRFDRLLKGLRKVFGIAMPVITAATMSTVLVACQPDKPNPPTPPTPVEHKHTLTHVAATTENCTQDGMREHWDCNSCGKTFSDSQGQHEVQKADLVVKAHHTLTHKTEQKATCTQDGNIDYFHCSACGENFLDENGKNKVDLDDTVIASKGHVVGEKWEHDENGHWKVCGACGQQIDYHAHNFEDYVCTECGLVDEQNIPLSDEEIVEKIYPVIKENLQNAIGLKSTLLDILAVDYNDTTLNLLVKNHKIVYEGYEADFLDYVTFSMKAPLTKENLSNGSYTVSSKTSGKPLIAIPLDSQDNRGIEILKKIDPDGDHEHYDFVSVSKGTGAILPGLGITTGYDIYTISEKGIGNISVDAQSSGITDPIQSSILNGIEEQNFHVYRDKSKFIEFGDNVIYNFNGLLNKTKETIYEILYDGIKVGTAQGNVMNYELVE